MTNKLNDSQILSEALDTERNTRKEWERRHKEETSELKKEVQNLRWKLRGMGVFWGSMGICLALAITAGLGVVMWKGLNSYRTGQCYVKGEFYLEPIEVTKTVTVTKDRDVQKYNLWRNVEWSSDEFIGRFDTFQEAEKIAGKHGCRIK